LDFTEEILQGAGTNRGKTLKFLFSLQKFLN
jgi:hypothetical protein